MQNLLAILMGLLLLPTVGCQPRSASQDTGLRSSDSPSPITPSSSRSAKETMERFRAVLLGDDINTAMWMLDNIDPSIPAAQSQRVKMQTLSNRMKREGYDFKVLEAKEMRDCAVAIIRDNSDEAGVNLDPVYLINRDGRWLISPSLYTWDQMGYMSKAQFDRFKELKFWFEIRKAEYMVILDRNKKD